VALVGYMRRDLVEERGWIPEADYKEGLAFSQLAPGPLAAQLAMYLGYVDFGVLGATATGVAFVLPSFLMVVALGWAYVLYGGLTWMQAVFYGVGASVIGIIAHSAINLTKRTIGKDWLFGGVYAASAAMTIATETESVWFFLAAGMLVWVLRTLWRRKRSMDSIAAMIAVPIAATSSLPAASGHMLLQLAAFFTKAGAFVFGSGLAIIPFLYGGVVTEHGWLTDAQFLDAVAVAMITPGPVVITSGFIGFLVAGLPGAIVTSLATFLPCYLITILLAPSFKKYGSRPGIVAFVNGVTAAAIGAIAGAVVVLGRRTIFGAVWYPDIPKTVILVITLAVLLSTKKVPEPVIVFVAAIAGLVLFPLVHP
jgi:chromate transporter